MPRAVPAAPGRLIERLFMLRRPVFAVHWCGRRELPTPDANAGAEDVRTSLREHLLEPVRPRLAEIAASLKRIAEVHELAQHAANAIAQHSRRGWRISKPTKRTHIDGIVAPMMALDRLENQPKPVQVLGWI